jgi:hypothetical protein
MSDETHPDFERKLSPEEEKDILLNFMGNTYGELKKLDGQITGSSSTLGYKSDSMKQTITETLRSNRPIQPPPPPPPPTPQVEQPQVEVQQPVQPIQQVMQPQIDDNQLSFNFEINEKEELFSLIEKVLTRLDKLHRKVDELGVSIKNNNVTSPPIKKTAKKKSVNKEET